MGFHTSQVRLKQEAALTIIAHVLVFPYLTGSIETDNAKSGKKSESEFPYLTGSIETIYDEMGPAIVKLFPYLTGSIETSFPIECCDPYSLVSIPHRFD